MTGVDGQLTVKTWEGNGAGAVAPCGYRPDILGEDLGTAYTTASSSVWLDGLDRGTVPYIQANSQWAIFVIGGGFNRARTVAPKR